jgi:ABC-2 type transport system ATP-binding protein
VIEVLNLRHAFGARQVLGGVSFHVPPGSVAGLVGPNAAGKTTLMRAVAGLLEPDGGRVRVGSELCREPGEGPRTIAAGVRRTVGYLPERTTPYPDLLSWEYLDLFAEIAGHTPPERQRRVAAGLAAMGLASRGETPTRELSKGLRQRLALAAVLMHDPPVLVLDEPTDGLDPASRALFLREVRALADGGRAVLLSSHVLPDVEEVADQVLILVDGKLSRDAAAPAGQRFSIRVRGDQALAARLLQARAEVEAVTAQDAVLVVRLRPGEADAAAAAAALVQAGFALVELRRDEESLGQRFARAVGEH